MATIGEKSARLQAIKEQLDALIQNGVDMNSPEALPLELEFVKAFDSLAQEFGYKILVSNKKERADFIRPDPSTQR